MNWKHQNPAFERWLDLVERCDPDKMDPNSEYHWESIKFGYFLGQGYSVSMAQRWAQECPDERPTEVP